jgi:transcriptional regulator with XRE-family HTH domain
MITISLKRLLGQAQWTGREAKLLRAALRLTVEAFAERLGVCTATVAKWERRGEDITPLPESQAILDTALRQADEQAQERFQAAAVAGLTRSGPAGSDGCRLADGTWDRVRTDQLAEFLLSETQITASSALRLSQDWRAIDPPQVVELRSGRRIGERLVHAVTERIEVLRHMDDFLGGGDLHGLVRDELRATLDMVRDASYTEPVGRALLAAVADLAQLAGWVASNAGLHALAEHYYLGGACAAHAAGDEPLAANLISTLSYQVANVGQPREAVLLAMTACQGAGPTATATTRALLLERIAWANARLGDRQATLRALGDVDETFTENDPELDPAFTYWLNRDEIDVMTGRCLTQLHQPDHAIELLTHAVDRYDATHERELALYLSWLAQAQVYAGNVEEAAAAALRALRLAATGSSVRSTQRLELLRKLLAEHRDVRAVQEFEAQARESLLGA